MRVRRVAAPRRPQYWPSTLGKRRMPGSFVYPSAKRARMARLRRRNIRTAGFLGIETKFYDTRKAPTAFVTTTAGAELDPAANASCLNAITQGDGESARDGKKCVLKSVEIHGVVTGTLKQDQADSKLPIIARVLLVWDKQTNGAQLNSEDVLKDDAGSDYLSMRNLQYSSRFRILWDRTFVLQNSQSMTDGANTSSSVSQTRNFKIYKKLNIPVNFTGTTEDIANITDNSLHIIGVASITDASIEYYSRVRFVG